jgi:hypothetical protein
VCALGEPWGVGAAELPESETARDRGMPMPSRSITCDRERVSNQKARGQRQMSART